MCFLSTTFPNAPAHPPPPNTFGGGSLTSRSAEVKIRKRCLTRVCTALGIRRGTPEKVDDLKQIKRDYKWWCYFLN